MKKILSIFVIILALALLVFYLLPEKKITAEYKDLIKMETPLPESTISSPLVIRGEARGIRLRSSDR